MAEKLTEEMTVKLSATGKRFVSVRAKQMGFESGAEYMRHLLSVDQEKAASDFNLLAEALGHNVIKETLGNQVDKSAA
jgi:hypothetical protein